MRERPIGGRGSSDADERRMRVASSRRLRVASRRWLSVVLSLGLLLAMLLSPASAAEAKEANSYTVLDETIDLLKTFHLSGVTEEELIEAAIEGILYELDDPYTEYFTADDLEYFTSMLNQVYWGTGMLMTEDQGQYVVTDVFADSPAAGQGLLEGDVIRALGGTDISTMALDDIDEVLYGAPGDKVTVTIERAGKTLDMTLEYGDVQAPLVERAYFGDGIGYIRLWTFTEESADEFAEALADLQKQGMKSLIVDLRDNSGGLVAAASSIAGYFYKANGPLAYLIDRNGRETAVQVTIDPVVRVNVPTTVLVNDWSASASEVLAGALKEQGLAQLVGEQTYGKGVVQNIYPLLTTGGALKVTVQQYYTPNRKQVHEVGIAPDIEVIGEQEQLLKSLHESGIRQMTIELLPTKMRVNGAMSRGKVDIVRKEGKTYLPARFLAAVMNADIAWQAKTKEVHMTRDGKTVKFPQRELLVKDGMNYIEVSVFQNAYPAFRRDASDGALRIHVKL